MFYQYDDFRIILKEELERRIASNPSYSLRAFARDLSMSSSRLSDVLNGRYGISKKVAKEISSRLSFSHGETFVFCNLVESQHARSKCKRELATFRLEKYRQAKKTDNLALDVFKIISDWYHFAILELTTIDSFKYDIKWIAKALDITTHEAKMAIDRLLKLNLLCEVNGTLRPTEDQTSTPSGIPSEYIKKAHKQILEKAMSSLYIQNVDNRKYSSSIVSIDKNDLCELNSEIQEFRNKIVKKINRSSRKNAVYALGIQFFELTEQTFLEQ